MPRWVNMKVDLRVPGIAKISGTWGAQPVGGNRSLGAIRGDGYQDTLSGTLRRVTGPSVKL